MMSRKSLRSVLLTATILATPGLAHLAGATSTNPVSTGQYLSPLVTPGASFHPLVPGLADNPTWKVGQAMNTALSPDGNTLLVVTSGYNLVNYTSGPNAGSNDAADSTEYVFIYDVSTPNVQHPALKQVVQVPNSFAGLVWSPDGSKFYVAGGVSDDVVVFGNSGGTWSQTTTVALGHASFAGAYAGTPFAALGAFLSNGIGFEESSAAAGLAVSADGTMLVVANIYNDSISVINTATNTVIWEYDLRPYKNTPAANGTAGGETPFAVAIVGNSTAYVTSVRDREVVAVPIGAAAPAPGTLARIPLPGSPNQLTLSKDQTRLYVAQDNSDTVAVIDTASNTVVEEIDAIAPPGLLTTPERYTGAATNSVALSPDGKTLYATNGGANDVAVIPLTGSAPHQVAGLIPTGWYPQSVTAAVNGHVIYVVNAKNDPKADPKEETGADNQYVLQTEKAGILSIPLPSSTKLAELTADVASNNGYSSAPDTGDAAVMNFLHSHIQHVIYIVKENRTFDQVLGDLGNGSNGKAKLTMYGKSVTPNFHALAGNFVTLDNFLCSGEVSGDGWAWSTEARESDFGVKTIPMNYAGRGSSNDSEGSNRDVNIGTTSAGRVADLPFLGPYSLYGLLGNVFPGGTYNLLPGLNNDFATDGPGGTPAQQGFLWDAALRSGLSVRDYGFFLDLSRYVIPISYGGIGLIENPAATSTTVAWSTNPTLSPYIDPYFRGFDNAFPDTWRWEEWNREFQQYVANGNLPTLSLVRFMHDHTGNFSTAAAGVNTPELQQADDDYAVGKLIESVANSPYANNTLIFVLEDDAQDGPDHVDAHRSTAYVVGAYVKQNTIVSTRYSTVNMVRTIEDILGTDHLNLNDTYQPPMADLFDVTSSGSWTYTATASSLLNSTGLAPLLPPGTPSTGPKPTHTAAWWAAKTKGYDWSSEDKIPNDQYNRIQWEGLKPGQAYPD